MILRRRMLSAVTGLLVIAGTWAGGVMADLPPEPGGSESQAVGFLAVGNSFSGNALRFLPELAEAGGHQLVFEHLFIGGGSLAQHWELAQQHQADPEAGRYQTDKSLHGVLQAQRWDYVSLQQASMLSHDYTTYQPHADELADFIRQHSPEAQLLVHQTWAYRADDPKFTPGNRQPGRPQTREDMHAQVTAAYKQLAEAIDARLVPVGNAFDLADSHPRWGFKPIEVDVTQFEGPDLPEQSHSLHAGYHWRGGGEDGPRRLVFDGHHASIAGRYLGACVFYEVLFGESVVGNPFMPDQLNPPYARFLQEVAHQAVRACDDAGLLNPQQ